MAGVPIEVQHQEAPMASVPLQRRDGETTKPELAQPLAPSAPATPEKEPPSESISEPPSTEEIYRLIREAAYFKAEARGFAPGVEWQDWLDAEQEVRQRLQIS